MKRLIFLALAALAALSSCGYQEDEQNGVPIYYIGAVSGMDRLEEQRLAVPEEVGVDEIIELVLAALCEPADTDRHSPVPVGVGIEVSRRGVVVSVDFGEGFTLLSPARKSLATAAVALSLLGLENVRYIYFTVQGEGCAPFYDRAATAASFITEQYAKSVLGQQ